MMHGSVCFILLNATIASLSVVFLDSNGVFQATARVPEGPILMQRSLEVGGEEKGGVNDQKVEDKCTCRSALAGR